MHKIKVKKLLHHEIHSGKLYSNSWKIRGATTTPKKKAQNGKLYSNSWRIRGATTTPKKKAQNGDAETHGQSYYKT
jgi:hypothetical protein